MRKNSKFGRGLNGFMVDLLGCCEGVLYFVHSLNDCRFLNVVECHRDLEGYEKVASRKVDCLLGRESSVAGSPRSMHAKFSLPSQRALHHLSRVRKSHTRPPTTLASKPSRRTLVILEPASVEGSR